MNLKKNKIFILDQDQNSAPKLVEVLEGAGFVVKWFVLRSKLLSALEVELPDLFIVDPHYDGEEGIRFLATRQSDLI